VHAWRAILLTLSITLAHAEPLFDMIVHTGPVSGRLVVDAVILQLRYVHCLMASCLRLCVCHIDITAICCDAGCTLFLQDQWYCGACMSRDDAAACACHCREHWKGDNQLNSLAVS
jgi:hypothetical protein